jgi:hypothetical protein
MRFAVVALLLASCAAAARPPAAPPRRLGDAMGEAGVRFNRVGRAVLAGRWQLASYDLKELDEIFAEDLATSNWHGKPGLAELASRFHSQDLAAVTAAVRAQDRDASARAIAQVARACNECHKKADMEYIEISDQPGAEAPVVTSQK